MTPPSHSPRSVGRSVLSSGPKRSPRFSRLSTRLVQALGLSCGLLGSAWLASACQTNDEDDLPYLPSCTDSCGSGTGTVVPPEGQAGESNSGESIILEGSVGVFSNAAFSEMDPFVDSAQVYGTQPHTSEWLEAEYTGELFQLGGVSAGSRVWFAASPEDQSTYQTVFSRQNTLSESGNPFVLPVARRAQVEEIFSSLLSSAPEKNSGHLVVRVIDEDGRGIAGVQLEVLGAELTAYLEQSEVWTNLTSEETSSLGLAFAGNIPARAFPGGLVEVRLLGEVLWQESVYIAQDALTVVEVEAQRAP